MNQRRLFAFSAALGALALGAWAEEPEFPRCPVIERPARKPSTPTAASPSSGLPRVAARAARLAGETPFLHETPHFAIYFATSGSHMVASTADNNGNDVPDVVDSIAAYAERSWRLAIDTLGYSVPKAMPRSYYWRQAVPAGKFPIEVCDLGVALLGEPYYQPWMGMALDATDDSAGQGGALLIENDFRYNNPAQPIRVLIPSGAGLTNWTDPTLLYDYSTPHDRFKGWKVAVSHEFFHNVQFEYDMRHKYSFHEMSAVWFALRAFPEVYHHWGYNKTFVANMQGGAFMGGDALPYANYVFLRHFAHHYGETAVKRLWEYRAGHPSTSEEHKWFGAALDSLGLAQLPLVRTYAEEIAKFLFRSAPHRFATPGVLNDSGKFAVNYVPKDVFYFDFISDRAPNTPMSFGVDAFTATGSSFRNGFNMQADSVPAGSPSAGFLVHLPSKTIEHFDNQVKSFVFTLGASDTGMTMVSVAGHPGIAMDFRATNAPITSISPRSRIRKVDVGPVRRVDLFGRPVRDGYQGIIFETSPRGTEKVISIGRE